MKAKKYRHADLENKRGIFFQIGLIVAMGAALAAFEWGTPSKTVYQPVEVDPYTEVQDIIPITRHEEPKKELPKVKQPNVLILTKETVGPELNTDFVSEDTGAAIEIPEAAPEEDNGTQTFHVVEHMPQFPGGNGALLKYIASSVQYPAICAELGIFGKVYISFVVDEAGNVVEVKVVRSPDARLSAEALRVVNSMPRWTPGRQRDKTVRVAFTIPVNFVLE